VEWGIVSRECGCGIVSRECVGWVVDGVIGGGEGWGGVVVE